MFGRSVTIFRLLGFRVKVDISWVFVAVLIAWSLAQGLFPSIYKGLPTATYWWMSVVAIIGLAFSIVFHEFAHSMVARQYGMPIRGITLFIFGGVAEMEDEPPSAKSELLMAIAGPIASLVIGGVFYLLSAYALAAKWPVPVQGTLHYLMLINLVLAVFNLVPAFPLDGGRVLRAILWAWRGDVMWATRIASGAGSLLGLAIMAVGIVNVVYGNFIGGIWWVLIGLFIRGAAGSARMQMEMRRAFKGERVSRLMTPRPVTVSASAPVADLVDDYIYRHHYDMFPVTQNGELVACVMIKAVKSVPRERWADTTVGEIASPLTPENTIDANADAAAALSVMRKSGNNRLIVTEGRRLVGVLALKDMFEIVARKHDIERAA
jgi:Zn-dependent protease/predicted transcriptional regulator